MMILFLISEGKKNYSCLNFKLLFLLLTEKVLWFLIFGCSIGKISNFLCNRCAKILTRTMECFRGIKEFGEILQ